jgi:hypothetical protein
MQEEGYVSNVQQAGHLLRPHGAAAVVLLGQVGCLTGAGTAGLCVYGVCGSLCMLRALLFGPVVA